jgi:hypothetical protein
MKADEAQAFDALKMLHWLSDANATLQFKKDSVVLEAGLQTIEAENLEQTIEQFRERIESE